jgi:Beta-galactosidase
MLTLSHTLRASIFTALCLALPATSIAAETYAPRVEFGARLEPGNRIIHGAGQDAKAFSDYAKNFDGDHQPLIYMSYIGLCKSVSDITKWGSRLGRELDALSPAKPIPQIGLNLTGGKDTGIGLDAEVSAGKFDAQIAAFADAVTSLGRPVFIRIGYEFEGKWNNYQPATFQQSWRHITRILRERNLPFATVWCVAGGSSGWPTIPKLMEFYPGDECVDWWGVDLFSAHELTHPQLEGFLDASRDHRKPVMIGEMTPRHIGVLEGQKSWDQWFGPMIDLLKRRPEIKATAYINWEWREQSDRLGFQWHNWGDARIEGNTLVRDRWVQELSNPIYLHATRDGSYPLPPAVIHVAKEKPLVVRDLTPLHDATRVLKNPHKGWYHHFPDNHMNKYRIKSDADLLEFPGMDHLYLRLAWSYLEPREGNFDWAIIDGLIEKWTKLGLGISFRISCKETSTECVEQQYATPRWVMEAGAKGGYYRDGKAAGPDAPWEPAFDDPIFLQKLENFLRAFAARYDGKPWLRYVDIGSIGDWGEGHTWAGSRKEYGFALRQKHVDLHLKYFRQSRLMISDDFVFALNDPDERRRLHRYVLDHGISYRDDSILVDGYLARPPDRVGTGTLRQRQAAGQLGRPARFSLGQTRRWSQGAGLFPRCARTSARDLHRLSW